MNGGESTSLTTHKNDDQMQNCRRLTLFDLRREKRPGNAYEVLEVSARELANSEVRSSTILSAVEGFAWIQLNHI